MRVHLGLYFVITVTILVNFIKVQASTERQIGDSTDSLEKLFTKYVTAATTASKLTAFPGSSPHPWKPQIISPEEILELLNNEDFQEVDETTVREVDRPCAHDLVRILFNITAPWAMQMIDSDGKLPSGLADGNVIWPGNYDECVETYAPATDKDDSFGGQYCTLSWSITPKKFNRTIPISTGICVPDSCDEVILKNSTIFQYLLQRPHVSSTAKSGIIGITDLKCKSRGSEWDAPAIAMLFILSIFGFFMVIGTSLTVFERISKSEYFTSAEKHCQDELTTSSTNGIAYYGDAVQDKVSVNEDDGDDRNILLPEKNSFGADLFKGLQNFFKCFCVLTNGSRILSTSGKGEFRSVHGIRFLSMTWVILGHTYAFVLATNIADSLKHVVKTIDTVSFQAIAQGTFSVDSFFVLSGFLLTYLFLKEMNSRGKVSWPMFYFHRYWRLTPVYAIVLGFDAALTKYVGDGPFWQTDTYEAECKNVWWQNLLYINNVTHKVMACLGWSWYLANDMQFYVISPLFLYPLWRWPRVGLSIISAMLAASWAASFGISYHYNVLPGYIGLSKVTDAEEYMQRMQDYMKVMYVKPYTRIGPYLIGVILGYLIYQHQKNKKSLSLPYVIIGWLVASALSLSMVYGFYGANLNNTESSFYNALSRSCYSLGLAWLIYACIMGYGGFINTILSHEVFIPLGRLTYCAYLVHPIIMTAYALSRRTTLHLTHITMTIMFLGYLCLSYATAFVTSLAFESPLMALEKLLLKKK